MDGVRRYALIGKSGAGKSEVASAISDQLQIKLVKTGAICRRISRLLFGNEDKRSTQVLDDVLTTIDPSIFVKAALREIDSTEGFVLDALRFHGDVIIAQKLGCKIIRVVADDNVRVRRLKARGQVFSLATDGDHRSETELDDISVNWEITNSGTKDELFARLPPLLA